MVHGCFWHRHAGCKRATLPKKNRQFWKAKFDSNLERDERKQKELKSLGFRVLKVWECEALDPRILASKLIQFFRANGIRKIPGVTQTETDKPNAPPRIEYASKGETVKRTFKPSMSIAFSTSFRTGNHSERIKQPYDSFDYSWLRRTRQPRLHRADGSKIVRTVDLFCGCGGLSLGIREACHFLRREHRILLAIDADKDAIDIFRSNLDPTRALQADVNEVFRLENGLIGDLLPPEKQILAQLGRTSVQMLVAGPPCQGFSDLNNHTRRSDDRNSLYLFAARAARVIQPQAVLIENVPAVQNDSKKVLEKTISALKAMGYHVDSRIVDLSEIGVPQQRRRHVVLGLRSKPTRIEEIIQGHMVRQPRSVRWAIDDLRKCSSAEVVDHSAKVSQTNLDRIRFMFERNLYDLPNSERPDCHKGDDHSYKSSYGRLHWGRPAQTVTSGFSSPGQGRNIHPSRMRTITPHEAARLQFFPDYFDFSAARTRSSLARVIGNAVPPKLSFVIAFELIVQGLIR